jgi:hypothetical protein
MFDLLSVQTGFEADPYEVQLMIMLESLFSC